MQNLTALTQTSAGNITAAKNFTVTGTATFNSVVDLSAATVTGMSLSASVVAPDADDGAALGSTSLKWSDLFLASGGVINFNSGNVTLTHSTGTLTMNNLLTLSGNTGITFTGTAITKGINFASAVAAMSDADDAFIAVGTWNDAVVVGTQTAHFVPIQVHLHSAVSAAYDIAAARLRVDTSAANTANALGCLQLRQAIAHNVASSAILNASVSVDGAVAVQTGSLLGGYFSIEGTGAITKAGDNDCTPLVAVNNNTGGGVDNVLVAMMNGTGQTVSEIINCVCEHGTATVGINIEKTSNGTALGTGIVMTGVTEGLLIGASTSSPITVTSTGTTNLIEVNGKLTAASGTLRGILSYVEFSGTHVDVATNAYAIRGYAKVSGTVGAGNVLYSCGVQGKLELSGTIAGGKHCAVLAQLNSSAGLTGATGGTVYCLWADGMQVSQTPAAGLNMTAIGVELPDAATRFDSAFYVYGGATYLFDIQGEGVSGTYAATYNQAPAAATGTLKCRVGSTDVYLLVTTDPTA